MSNPELTLDDDVVRFHWDQRATTVLLSRFRETASGTNAELTVLVQINGSDKRLTQGVVNLSNFTARERLCKRLKQLHDQPYWDQVVETACVRGLDEYRRGQPAESLEPQPDDQPAWFLCNPLLYQRHPTLLYGPGESGKSFFALYVTCNVASGGTSTNLAAAPDGHDVLYLDWELRAPEMRARVRQLRAGHPELSRAPLHRAMHLPLASCATEIRREIRERDINVVVIDSLGPATGGEIERAADPVAFFNALHSLDCTSLLIGHVAKPADDDKGRTPYGSVYYYNLARSIFEMRLVSEPESTERTICLYHRKNNLGPKLLPIGYRLTITQDQAQFTSCDPTAEPDLARGLSYRERIKRLLADHASRTVPIIAETLSIDEGTTSRTLRRYKGRDWHCLTEGRKGQESTWGVL